MYCGIAGNYDAEWWYSYKKDFQTLTTKRSRKCCSCNTKLSPGAKVLQFTRWRDAQSEIEERFYDSEVPLAAWYMCEECGAIAIACEMSDVGFNLGCENLKLSIEDFVGEK